MTVFDYQPYDQNAYDPADGCDGASADVNKVGPQNAGSHFADWHKLSSGWLRTAYLDIYGGFVTR